MKKYSIVFVSAAIVLIAGQAGAYRETTHGDISRFAVKQSVINSSSGPLRDLGLGRDADDFEYRLPGSASVGTPLVLIARGSIDEDAGSRSLNHFQDPQRAGTGLSFGINLGLPSASWALEDTGLREDQHFSWADAKVFLKNALRRESKTDRDRNLGLMFESLGHAIHHVQDMSQPQHTRNDGHCDDSPLSFFFDLIALPNGCATFLLDVAYRPSAYEQFAWELGRLPLAGYVVPDYATFDSPRDHWVGEGRGIAEFTSNNFLSVGSNFRLDRVNGEFHIRSHDGHPFPQGSEASLSQRDIATLEEDPHGLAGDISLVSTPIRDIYASGFSGANDRSSTLSLFHADLVAYSGDTAVQQAFPYYAFTMNRVNYSAALDRLGPRAAAYSTGLINYFFRGRIDIKLPAAGVYGVLDHGTTKDAGQGFTKMTVALRNATPDGVPPQGTPAPQEMSGGTLTLIAKYYVNTCYTPDLLGEFNGATNLAGPITRTGCFFDAYFGGIEKIAVSKPLAGRTLSRTAHTEVTFDLSDQPIPVNAHDLSFQVVYEGVLGAEPDAIAVSATNGSEPTYLTIMNGSDYYAVDGVFYTPQEIRSDPALLQRVGSATFDPEPLHSTRFSIGTTAVTGLGSVEAKGFHRIAVLADAEIRPPLTAPPALTVRVQGRYPSTTLATSIGATNAIRNQLVRAPYVLSPISTPRGVPVWYFVYFFKHIGVAPSGSAFAKPALVDPACRLPSGQYVCAPAPTPIPLAS